MSGNEQRERSKLSVNVKQVNHPQAKKFEATVEVIPLKGPGASSYQLVTVHGRTAGDALRKAASQVENHKDTLRMTKCDECGYIDVLQEGTQCQFCKSGKMQ